ncbi:MAG TPA: DUF4169 family protein [Vitreimonas sp.]|uniref:DUF4169 family protein n=1 Tax=Vitreimonas sp. TaxID=3069702 RepID=UPI002D3F9692|nr:DUF4169 family protein [Vitreimonas sp.]HYD89377.1 DUF4169 family protein [Vitreimonas sp.]
MNEIVNLKRVRKAKARAAEEITAANNRMAFGRTKTEKQLAKAEREAADRKLDGHKRHDNDTDI